MSKGEKESRQYCNNPRKRGCCLQQGGVSGGIQNWSDSRKILNIDPTSLSGEMDIVDEGKKN